MRAPRESQGPHEGGKSAVEMAADEAAWRDSQKIKTSCGLCKWKFVGLAGEGRERAAAHRQEKHPEVAGKRPRSRKRAHYRIRP